MTGRHVWSYVHMCLLVMLIRLQPSWAAATSDRREPVGSSCDPVVDMLFVVDNSSEVSPSQLRAQVEFVDHLLKLHHAPKGAVRAGIVTCGDKHISTTIKDSFTSLLDPFGTNNFTTEDAQANSNCLASMNLKFKTESRDGAAKIAVVLKSVWNWDVASSKMEAELARQADIVLVVIAIGIQDFESLSALQTVAREEGTFFVVARYADLKNLASNLSKDACRPVSLDLTSGSVSSQQTTKPPHVPPHELCIQLGRSLFKRFVPGFGYIRHQCSDTQTLNVTSCSCA